MQAAAAPHEESADIATAVLATMRQMGVLGLPRNYEIFYEALAGSNEALSIDVVSLSKRPTQDDLDAIGRKYFAHNHGREIVESAREVIARELEEIATILRAERKHLEKYGRVLDETSNGLTGAHLMSRDMLQKISGVLSVATSSTIDHGRQIATSLGDKSAELEAVKTKLEEYKRLADTDPLTHLWNRRAFDKAVSTIYNSSSGILFKALILADVDRFKDVNDRFGHPVGDRILQTIAGVLRSSTREDVFVARTGGEEFALILDGLNEDATYAVAERLRILVEQMPLHDETGADYSSVTLSMGICMASEADDPHDLYVKSDRALYRSKLEGRNRVTRHSTLSERQGKGWMLYRKD